MFLRYLKRKLFPAKEEANPIEEVSDNLFHGVDLDDWNYIGQNKITYTSKYMEQDIETGSATVFFFSEYGDDDTRKYVIVCHYGGKGKDHKLHPWILKIADPWRIGELPLYRPVTENPGKYLQEFMLENYNAVWREQADGQWWWKKTGDAAKYDAAAAKQQKPKETKPEITQTDDEKIITVEFGKKD